MPLPDMLDVLHYFFEEDMNYSTAEQADAQSAVRKKLYADMYDQVYKYGSTKSSSGVTGNVDIPVDLDADVPVEPPVVPFNPRQPSVKAYTPPTKVDGTSTLPFGSILDAPLG